MNSQLFLGSQVECKKIYVEYISELEIDVINVTEAKLQKSYITFNAFDLHFDISLENVESRASNGH